MEIIVLMPNGPVPPSSPSPVLFIQFIQITSLNKRDKNCFDLVSFEDIYIESCTLVAGDTSTEGSRVLAWDVWGPPWRTPGWGWG